MTQLPDTKTTTYIELGDIEDYETNGFATFSLPGVSTSLQTKMLYSEYTDSTNYVWSGSLVNQLGYFSLIATPGGVSGFVQMQGRFFSIHPVKAGIGLLRELDLAYLSPEDCGVSSENSSLTSEVDWCDPEENDCPADIDVLILLTPDVATWLNGSDNPWRQFGEILQGLASINLAFVNSDITNKRIHWQALNFDFQGFDNPLNINDDIQDLSDEAGSLRAQYQADLVIMLTSRDYPGIAGAAQGPGGCGSPAKACAYSIVEIQSIADPRWTFAHEFAHLLGARHNRPDNCSAANVCGDDDADVCSHGWVFNDQDDDEQRTILARMLENEQNAGAVRILHYSNPDVDFNGAPTGTADNNNARIIRNAACYVATFNSADWQVDISSPDNWCLDISNSYTMTAINQAPIAGWGHPGVSPYQYEWRWSTTANFATSYFLSNQSTFTLNGAYSGMLPYFWLRLIVTSSDNHSQTVTKSVNVWSDCHRSSGQKQQEIAKALFPNPSDGFFTVPIPNNNDSVYEVLLYDANGKLEKSLQTNGRQVFTIDDRTLTPGIYQVVVKGPTTIDTYKVVIYQ